MYGDTEVMRKHVGRLREQGVETDEIRLADHVVVMTHGEVVQVGTPEALFEAPAHRFVGHFIGSPGMNFLPCRVEQADQSISLRLGDEPARAHQQPGGETAGDQEGPDEDVDGEGERGHGRPFGVVGKSERAAGGERIAGTRWRKLDAVGFERIGILGTSLGSCLAMLTSAHEPLIRAQALNHVSPWFADVVWRGLSTRHVREGLDGHIDLDEIAPPPAPDGARSSSTATTSRPTGTSPRASLPSAASRCAGSTSTSGPG